MNAYNSKTISVTNKLRYGITTLLLATITNLQCYIKEKNVLDLVDFPFILNFMKSFDDQYNLFFLTEFIRGMELFDVIRDIGN